MHFIIVLTSVIIPESVRRIGYQSFANAAHLASVTIRGNGLESIGDDAGANFALNTIVFPKSVTSIGTYVFQLNSA